MDEPWQRRLGVVTPRVLRTADSRDSPTADGDDHYVVRVILWINGTFGVGKTTTAKVIREQDPAWRLFDPEWVGYMLRANLSDLDIGDFQQLPPWRALVPRVAHEIASLTGDRLVAVQTVLVEQYWDELRHGFADQGIDLFHVVLDVEEPALLARIAADEVDPCAEPWRVNHIAADMSARPWMTAREAAAQIVEALK